MSGGEKGKMYVWADVNSKTRGRGFFLKLFLCFIYSIDLLFPVENVGEVHL